MFGFYTVYLKGQSSGGNIGLFSGVLSRFVFSICLQRAVLMYINIKFFNRPNGSIAATKCKVVYT